MSGRRLGPVDIAVADGQGGWQALLELKWCLVDGLYMRWAIWDFYKLATGRVSPGADACYLVAGAPDRLWEQHNTVADLFRTNQWDMADVYHRYEDLWLHDGHACEKLTGLPAEIATELVVDQTLPSPLNGWRLKAIRIEPVPSHWLPLSAGRLVPDTAPVLETRSR